MLEHPYEVIDVCGTGGDGAHTLNISTAVAFVAAGARPEGRQARQPRDDLAARASSDVLTALGVNIAANLAQQRAALDEAGICFLFAPAHHGAMRHVLPIRQELGFRTIFNLLGPLSNPAGAQRQVLGVFDSRWVEPLARVLGALGAERAWVVHGDGLDEMTTTGDDRRSPNGATAACACSTSRPRRSACRARRWRTLRGGDPAANAARASARCWPARPAPTATSCC